MSVQIIVGHALDQLRLLPDESVHCCVTSPPYFGLRSYGTPPQVWGGDASCEHQWGEVGRSHHPGQVADGKAVHRDNAVGQNAGSGQFCGACGAWRGDLGLEPTPDLYVEHLVEIFREVRRVLRKDGTLFLNIGDSYAGSWGAQGHRETPATLSRNQIRNHPKKLSQTGAIRTAGLKPKDLIGIPWMLAFALRADGWWLRSDIIWSKVAPMPESVTDRPTCAHEHVFLLSKSGRYFYDAEAVKEESVSDHDSGNGFKRAARLSYADADGPRGSGQQWRRPQRGAYPSDSRAIGQPQQNGPDGAGGVRGTRNMRNVWHLGPEPFPEAHFATFPTEVARRAILAGTSAHGCCATCGAPWERVTDRKGWSSRQNSGAIRGSQPAQHRTYGAQPQRGNMHCDVQTLGWRPTCSHAEAAVVPACVLDPFGGSGTVGIVADRLRRDAALIELNPEYAEMTRRRIVKDAGLFANVA